MDFPGTLHMVSTAHQVIAVSLSALPPVPRLKPWRHIVLPPPPCLCVCQKDERKKKNEDGDKVCVCVGLCIKKAEWDWLRDNDVWNINPRSSVPIKPPVSRPPSCMQMNQYKGRAWFHRLRPHFFATQTTEELVYCVSHIEMMDKKKIDAEGRGRTKKM